MALNAERDTPARESRSRELPVASGATIYAGGLTAISSTGFLKVPSAATDTVVGRAKASVANPGADGAINGEVERGCFRYGNSAGADEITAADIGSDCYAVDDETVAKTNGSNARPRAGLIFAVDAQGVWVETV